MQNFLFRKNSHSASVVAKALPRPPESPPSPSPAPVRGSGSVSRIRRTAGGSPHRTDRPPKDRGTPKQRRENARKPERRDANGPRYRRNAPPQAGMPLCRRTKPQDAAICRSPSDVWADRASERIRRFAAECRSDTPPNRPANRSAADECYRRRQKIRPLDRVRRAGATVLPLVCRAAAAKRPTAPYSARGRRQRRRAAKPAQSDVCANLLRGPDKKRPDQSGHPDRHAIAPDTTHTPDTRQTPHTRQTRTSRDEPRTTRLRHGNDMPHTTEQLPDNQPIPDKQPCRERPHRTATNTVGSFGRDKSHNPERPFSSSAPPVTMPSTLPDTTFAAPAGYNARNLAEYNARSPAGYDASAPPDTTFAAPPDTAFPHRSRTIPFTPLRPVRYKSGTAAARTAESRSKLW